MAGIVLLPILLGCPSSKTEYFPDSGPVIRWVVVTPAFTILPPNGRVQLQAKVYAADSTILTDRHVAWTVGNTNIATISSTGLVSAGLERGNTYISATLEGVTSNLAIINVAYPPSSLAVSPDSASLLVGGTVQLQWTFRDSTSSVLNLVPTFTSSNPVSVLVDPSGLVTARQQGMSYIVASYNQLRDTTIVRVNTVFDSLRIVPNSVDLNVGSSALLSAIAWFQMHAYYPTAVQWNSQNSAIARVSQQGVVTGVDTGTTTVNAAFGNLIAPPITVRVTGMSIRAQSLLVADADSLWMIDIQSRRFRTLQLVDYRIRSINRSDQTHPIALLDENRTIHFIDPLTSAYVGESDGWMVDSNTIGWSNNSDRLLAKATDGQIHELNISSFTHRRLLPDSIITTDYRFSSRPFIDDTTWLIAAKVNNTWNYYAIGFSGTIIASSVVNGQPTGPINVNDLGFAVDLERIHPTRITIVNNAIIQTPDFDLTIPDDYTEWVSVSQSGLIALARRASGVLSYFTFSSSSIQFRIRVSGNYQGYSINEDPETLYIINNNRILRMVPEQDPEPYTWISSGATILAIER